MERAAALIDHACQLCGGRLMRTDTGVMCACCEVAGTEPADICFCGAELRTGERLYRCTVGDGHAPGFGPRIVAGWTGPSLVPRKRKPWIKPLTER